MSSLQDIFDAIMGAKKGNGHTVVVMHPTDKPTETPTPTATATPTDSLGLGKTLGGGSKAGKDAYAALEDN